MRLGCGGRSRIFEGSRVKMNLFVCNRDNISVLNKLSMSKKIQTVGWGQDLIRAVSVRRC